MIPILYNGGETDFSAAGIGFLTDCIECTVTEERNSVFECEFSYPIIGRLYTEISADRIIKVKANENSQPQLFRIYRTTKPMNGIVKYYANHISYDLGTNITKPINMQSANATAALNAILDNCYYDHNFRAVSDITTTSNFNVKVPTAARNCMGGMEGSVLDIYGGEYEFDNFTIKLHAQRGTDTGVTIMYGKNLSDIKADTNISSTYTSIYPYVLDSDNRLYELPEKVIELQTAGNYGESKTLALDLSDKFEEGEAITESSIRSKAEAYISSNKIDSISQNIEISFVHLWQTEEYKQIAPLERVSLCDTVTVKHEKLGISVKAKVIKTVYDSLLEKYIKIEIGSAKSDFAETISSASNTIQTIQRKVNSQSAEMKRAIDNATSIITGQLGGYVVFNPKEYPEEILIMDEPDIQQAQKIWRWNLGGLAYSSTGYNGTFATAITMDGSIVADFITTGILNASLIKTGTLQGVSIIGETGSIAGWKMQNGVLVSEDNTLKIDSGNNTISVYDDNQNRLMVLSKSGINMYRDGKYIGFIGTNHITGTNKYGLVFDLDVDGDYMSWAKMNQQTGNYTIVLQYSDTDGFEFSDKVKINGETKISGNTEISNITSLGSGGYTTVTDTINFVKSITVDSNGVVTSYDTGSLSIRNGVITGAF